MASKYTLNLRLKIFKPLISLIIFNVVFILSLQLNAQNTYTLNLSDTSSYDNGCGKITAASWTVKYDSCILHTPYFRRETTGCGAVDYNFRLNQSGNGDANDIGYVQYQLNNGIWVTDTIIYSADNTAVHNLIGSVNLCLGDLIRLRVVLKTDNKSEFWSIMNGDITLAGSFTTYSGNPPPLEQLPVELAYFSGNVSGENTLLKWASYSETDCDYYVVERSTDGKLFKSIASIKGAGNTNSLLEYKYEDKEQLTSSDIYYRLKQTDFNGKYAYYGPVVVSKKIKEEKLIVFPNPVSSSEKISISVPDNVEKEYLEVSVYNAMGELIYKSHFNGVTDNLNITSKGVYILSIISDQSVLLNEKVIVQ